MVNRVKCVPYWPTDSLDAVKHVKQHVRGSEKYWRGLSVNWYSTGVHLKTVKMSVTLRYSSDLATSDPQHNPVLIVGQVKNLNKITFDQVKRKVEPRVTEEVCWWIIGISTCMFICVYVVGASVTHSVCEAVHWPKSLSNAVSVYSPLSPGTNRLIVLGFSRWAWHWPRSYKCKTPIR